MKIALTIGALGALLAIAGFYSFSVWDFSGGTALGLHGWIAIVLGVVATFAVGAGLMTLVFYSSRRGYDEQHDETGISGRTEYSDIHASRAERDQ